ncbi:tetratricopeptide repeat protein 28-like [Oculina patagonica]
MEIGDRAGEAVNYGQLGHVFKSLGDVVKAKEYHEKALVINIEIGNRAGEAANYRNLGTVYLHTRNYKKSNEYVEKALEITKESGNRAGEASAYINLGAVFQCLGDCVKAKEYLEQALAVAIQIGDREIEAFTCVNLGIVFHSLGEYVMAEEYLEKALPLEQDIRASETEFICYCHLALTKLSQEKFQEAFHYLSRSIEKCEEMQGLNADNDQIKISVADMHVFPYKAHSILLCDAGNPNHALYVVELGRARALADLMADQYSAETHISANPQSWIGIENVMTNKSNCTCLYISYYHQRVFFWILEASGVISFREMTVDKNTLFKRLAQPAVNLDEFFAIMAKSFRSFGILPEEVCEDRSLNDIEPAESDSSQEERLAALRHGKDEKGPEPSLTLFYEMLINPVSDLLQEPEIIIVPDRNLYRVPFAALLDKNRKYLSETFRIRIIPSLTTLKLIQDSPADYHSQTGALIVGDPDVGEVIYCGSLNRKFVPLPGARKEAEMIGRLLGVEPLLGQHATKHAVLQRIESVSLIHFAAHGNAERGEIALSPASTTTGIPQEDDYLLKMSDISQVQLRAKLVVLSCCHSGRGQIRAEGVVGIARAFLGSGARSVLAALWALEDSATKQFMSCFYDQLVRGESASESLYKAIKWMRDNGFNKVSEWAPFMLIGDNVTFDFKK